MTGYQLSDLSEQVQSIHLYYTGKGAPKCAINFKAVKNDSASSEHHLEAVVSKKLRIDMPLEVILEAIVKHVSSDVDKTIADCLNPTKVV